MINAGGLLNNMAKMSGKAGRKPYGSTPKQIEAIKLMRRQRNIHHRQRKSYCEIANFMNERNLKYPKGSKKHFPPPAGKCWYATSVENILKRVEVEKLRECTRKVRKYLDIPQATKLWQFVEQQCRAESYRAKRRRAIIATLLFSGLRVSELCNLQYRDLPIKHGKKMIAVRRRKPQKKYGEVLISQRLTDILNGFFCVPRSSLCDTAWAFPNEAGKKQNRSQVWDTIKRIGRTLNLEFLGPHCLRHSYASILLFDTKSPHFVKRQLGHRSLATTDIYIDMIFIHLDENTRQEVYSLLEAINPRRLPKP